MYANVKYIKNRVSEEMEYELERAKYSQNPNEIINNFEFHLFKTPPEFNTIIFCVTTNDKKIYISQIIIGGKDENGLCEFLYDQYKLYRNNAALAMFMSNPLDKPEKFYYSFFK